MSAIFQKVLWELILRMILNPKYITIRGKGEILAQLRKEVKKADKVYLATDPDREGEAISWHLYNALKLGRKEMQPDHLQ